MFDEQLPLVMDNNLCIQSQIIFGHGPSKNRRLHCYSYSYSVILVNLQNTDRSISTLSTIWKLNNDAVSSFVFVHIHVGYCAVAFKV